VCKFAQQAGKAPTLAAKAVALAEAFEQHSQTLADRASTLEGRAAERALHKSKGVQGKSKDVEHCLARLTVSSTPPRAVVRINGQTAGKTPCEIPVFAGEQAVSVQLDGYVIARKKVQIDAAEVKTALFTLERRRLATGIPVDQTVADGDGIGATLPWLWPAVTAGTGLALAGVGGYLMIDAADTSQKADERQIPITLRDYEAAEDRHSMGLTLAAIGTALAVGGAVWWFTRDGPRNGKTSDADSQPAVSVLLAPGMIFLTGGL